MTDVERGGAEVYSELRGEHEAHRLLDLTRQSGARAELARLAVEFVYGRVWARKGLKPSQRSLVTIGVLIALRQIPELENHIDIALANGLDRRELAEAIIQSAPYAGFPAAWAAAQALDRHGQEPMRTDPADGPLPPSR